MRVLANRNVNISVDRFGDKVLSITSVIDNGLEFKAGILSDIRQFKIIDSFYIILRGDSNVDIDLDFLKNQSSYIEGKANLKLLSDKKFGKLLKYALSQCINGIIQAETYIHIERGFDTREKYNMYWDNLEKNGCRMYSNIDDSDLRWMDYINPSHKKNNLFNRSKSSTLFQRGELFTFFANFIDSYHQFTLSFDIKDNVISCADMDFTRAPGKACFTNPENIENLVGIEFSTLTKKEVVDILGRSQGCYHVVDIFDDILFLRDNYYGEKN